MPAEAKWLISKLPPKVPFPFVIARAVPPSEWAINSVVPPKPVRVPPLLTIVALPALGVSRFDDPKAAVRIGFKMPPKTVTPPSARAPVPPLLVIVAFAALDLTKKAVTPPSALGNVAPLLMMVALPAVDAAENAVTPNAPLVVP